ncbi:class I SAM-dependent methyltransferase [bacterium]|nr:class I SAM-dependent methyltransferase [bacterium]
MNNKLNQEWLDLSGPWIKESREGRNANRVGLLDVPLLKACGDVSGQRILDCGCGEGRFCRILAERGADYILGLDLCETLVDAAREIQSAKEEYRVADVQDLSFILKEEFDLVVSYLCQCDLPDFDANNREVHRVLKKGGRFIVANLHPMRSAVGAWHRDAEGVKQHIKLDRYFEEGERCWRMLGCDFTNFHRTLQTYLDSFLEAGFLIERIIEPTVTTDRLKEYPELDDEIRVPNFIVYVLRK